MKYFVLLFLLICQLSNVSRAHAASPTPSLSPSPKPTEKPPASPSGGTTLPLDEQINQLKDRIASRVAELKLVERRGIVGTVTDVSDTQIRLSDTHTNIRFVDVDELTKFSSPSTKESFGISDITKGAKVEVLGLYNKQSRRILARFVTVTSTPAVLRGAVVSVDSNAFVVRIITDEKEEIAVDVETMTKTSSYTKEGGLVRSGFSKIREGSHIVVIGLSGKKEKNLPAVRQGRITASRIILLPEIPKNPKITLPQPALNPAETIPPSTGSGKKLTPITR